MVGCEGCAASICGTAGVGESEDPEVSIACPDWAHVYGAMITCLCVPRTAGDAATVRGADNARGLLVIPVGIPPGCLFFGGVVGGSASFTFFVRRF